MNAFKIQSLAKSISREISDEIIADTYAGCCGDMHSTVSEIAEHLGEYVPEFITLQLHDLRPGQTRVFALALSVALYYRAIEWDRARSTIH